MLHLKGLSPLCVFKCILKLPACKDVKSHWLHLCYLSSLCVFICLFKLPASADPKSHCLHLYDFLLLCVFKYLPKMLVWEEVESHWLHLLGLFKRLLLIFVTIKTSWIMSSQIFKSTFLRFWSMPCGSKYNFRRERRDGPFLTVQHHYWCMIHGSWQNSESKTLRDAISTTFQETNWEILESDSGIFFSPNLKKKLKTNSDICKILALRSDLKHNDNWWQLDCRHVVRHSGSSLGCRALYLTHSRFICVQYFR